MKKMRLDQVHFQNLPKRKIIRSNHKKKKIRRKGKLRGPTRVHAACPAHRALSLRPNPGFSLFSWFFFLFPLPVSSPNFFPLRFSPPIWFPTATTILPPLPTATDLVDLLKMKSSMVILYTFESYWKETHTKPLPQAMPRSSASFRPFRPLCLHWPQTSSLSIKNP